MDENQNGIPVIPEESIAPQGTPQRELISKQVWQENEHENPFDRVEQARILETKISAVNDRTYVKFEVFRLNDSKQPPAVLMESDFRACFPVYVSDK